MCPSPLPRNPVLVGRDPFTMRTLLIGFYLRNTWQWQGGGCDAPSVTLALAKRSGDVSITLPSPSPLARLECTMHPSTSCTSAYCGGQNHRQTRFCALPFSPNGTGRLALPKVLLREVHFAIQHAWRMFGFGCEWRMLIRFLNQCKDAPLPGLWFCATPSRRHCWANF